MLPIIDHEKRTISGIAAALLAATAGLAAVTAAPIRAHAEDLIVKYDQSQILKLPRPVAEIIIGNPMIADVAIQSNNLLVVTGKSFGVTNIIVLDADRNIIQDQRVMVQREDNKIVYLQKGAKRESWNCSPQCNPTITVGDDTAYFDTVAKNSERKIKMIEGQTDGASIASSQ